MPLLDLVVVLIVVGLLLALVNQLLPMEPRVKQLLNIVVLIALIIFCLNAFGLLAFLGSVRVPRV